MIKEMIISFIYAKDCPDCKEMKETIEQAIDESVAHNDCTIKSINSENDEAIDLAIEYDITDLPGCVIGNFVFFGKNYQYEDILNAIEETWKNA
jgi:thiol-disulfide isomerase/thioredoxin